MAQQYPQSRRCSRVGDAGKEEKLGWREPRWRPNGVPTVRRISPALSTLDKPANQIGRNDSIPTYVARQLRLPSIEPTTRTPTSEPIERSRHPHDYRSITDQRCREPLLPLSRVSPTIGSVGSAGAAAAVLACRPYAAILGIGDPGRSATDHFRAAQHGHTSEHPTDVALADLVRGVLWAVS